MVRGIRYIFTVCLILASSPSLTAQDISAQNSRRDTLRREIEFINRQLAANRQKQKDNLSTLTLTQQKIQRRKKLISDMDVRIDGYRKAITSRNTSISRLNSRLDTLTAYYESLIYSTYKNRDSRIWFMYLLSSDNISQAARRWSYLKNISASVRTQASEIKSTRLKLEEERREFKNLVSKSDQEQEARREEFDRLSQEEQALSKSMASLSGQEKIIRRQLAAKQKEVDRLNREIEKIISEDVKEDRTGEETVQEQEIDLSGPFAAAMGQLPFPVEEGVVTEPYGQSEHPVFKDVKLPFNNGINISVPEDSPAMAVFGGRVKQILVIPGYSQCVLVQHGRFYTFYCKLRKSSVKAGEKVKAGDEIGTVETTADGMTVLHFELWDGTAKQDPQLWLRH